MTHVNDLSPETIQQRMQNHEILLIDVREAAEYAVEHIAGAVLCPLSGFDPAALPAADGREIVFHCAGGKRSAAAVARCQERGLPWSGHMAGGILAWKAAGLPIVVPGRD